MPDVPQLRRDVGQALVEYALVLALITLVSVSVMRSVGADISSIFGQASSALTPGAGGGGNGNGNGPGGNGNGNNGNGNGNGGPSGNNPGNGNAGGGGGRP